MSAAAEAPFAYAFAALLGLGSVVLLFVPLFRHLSDIAAGRRAILIAVGGLIGLGAAATVVIGSASSNGAVFLPVAVVTVILRLSSPGLLYRGIRERFEAERTWSSLRIVLAVAFLGLAGLGTFNLGHLLAGANPPVIAGLSEQFAMAFGASFLFLRTAFRLRPHLTANLWPFWLSATAFALAFVVVAPYAFPAFAVTYALSGIVGWILGAFVLRFVE
ncbi:MAG: hypothetical protein E6K19_07390 [Methanobacteriota archaeon]|nr:MAG: hypothetical protein E6K19_07390 [Euryarchaeota archaeon]